MPASCRPPLFSANRCSCPRSIRASRDQQRDRSCEREILHPTKSATRLRGDQNLPPEGCRSGGSVAISGGFSLQPSFPYALKMTYPRARGSPLSQIEAELGSPSVQLRELPGPGPHRQMFMPGPRLVEAEFRNELIHLRVELDDHLVGIIMIAGDVVARRVARGAPDLLYAGGTKTVRRHCMVCGVLELEGDVMKPRLRGADHVDHVVVSVTGEKGRDPLDIVRVAEAKELLVEFDELLAFR